LLPGLFERRAGPGQDRRRVAVSFVVPARDRGAGLLGLDRPPQPAGARRPAAVRGGAGQYRDSHHRAVPVADAVAHVERLSGMPLRLGGPAAVDEQLGQFGAGTCLPPGEAGFSAEGGAAFEQV
jgi:hypothetical protein